MLSTCHKKNFAVQKKGFINTLLLIAVFLWAGAISLAQAITLEEVEPFPSYVVKFVPSNPLPIKSFTLTKRALRILPQYFSDLPALEKKHKQNPAKSYIEISQIDKNKYCDTQRKICWPKKIIIWNGYMDIYGWEGAPTSYKDSKNLSSFLWNEGVNALGKNINSPQ